MKKIILIVVLFLCFNKNIYAKTYYGEYKYIGTNEQELSDEIKSEEVKLYNTYSLEYKDLGYLESNDLYIRDESDYVEKKLYTEEYEDEVDELVVIPSTNFQTCSFKISNISFNTKISEIELFYNNEKIDYKFMYNYISNSDKLNDNNYDTYATFLSSRSYILFDTNINFGIHNLKIVIHTKEENNKGSLDIVFGYDSYNIKLNNNKKHEYIFKDIEDMKYMYLKNIKLYRYYELIKNIDNVYVNSGENIILDDFKYIKKYYKRDKLVLSDNNIIDDTYNTLNSFIEYSSGDVDIDCNIDYLTNGEYVCIYKLNDIRVDKKIIVNNKIKEDSVVNVKKKNIVESTTSNINKKINSLKTNTNKTLTINKDIKKSDTKDKSLINIIKYLIIMFMICIEIILYIKRKRKNVERV